MNRLLVALISSIVFSLNPCSAENIIVEGESFHPMDENGWALTHQNDSYGSHTYGGMWMTHGACLGAAANRVGSVAKRMISVPVRGGYRVWSKYQAPPYFNYLHKIEILQHGKLVYSHLYGKKRTDRLWSFSAASDELWWPWGVDHDAAEAPHKLAQLQRGPAEIRLIAVANPHPAGDRFVDFVVLTTNPRDEYEGYKPYRVASPFTLEALAATKLYMRFKNTTGKAAQMTVRRNGHYQPQYQSATATFPEQPVAPSKWSRWFNIGPFCRLVHDEGLFLTVPNAEKIPVQFARDAAGRVVVGDFNITNGSAAAVPLEITWKKDARVKPSEAHARHIIALSKQWRKANGGRKPQKILFYGAFRGKEPWIMELKAALGYNTLLPDRFEHVHRDGMHTHAANPKRIKAVAAKVADKSAFRIMSFGDEISLGQINYQDPALQNKFRNWLDANGITKTQLGVPPGRATLTRKGDPQLVWYSAKFNEEQRFAAYREMTNLTKELLGPKVLTGANYSPHHGVLYYGPIFQWVDLFKHQGMSMFWSEDYVFSVPEVPQIISFMYAQARCAVKYHGQPIHFYCMPHSPGQAPQTLRRNILLSIGYGAAHIDNFWIAPAENFTENYVGWNYVDTFRTISEAIYDTAEVEAVQHGGKLRPARVAVVTGRATDFNESRLMLPKGYDPFAAICKNAPKMINQNLCRKEQQMLYLALKNAQYAVDAVTEEDIVDGALKNYDVVYFAGEWIDRNAVECLSDWIKKGGVLFASAGAGHLDQFGKRNTDMRNLLGLKKTTLRKNLVRVRTLLELPLAPAIDTISLNGKKVEAIGMRQQLFPAQAKVLGTWESGGAAVTVHEYGQGKAFTVGTCAGTAWMKTALRPVPFARGGRKNLYNPVDFSAAATELIHLGLQAKKIDRAVVCSEPGVEAIVLDNKAGTLLTLVNWTNSPLQNLQVQIRLDQAPSSARSVRWQKEVPVSFQEGKLTLKIDLEDADYVLLKR